MAISIDELNTLLNDLKRAKYSGELSVTTGDGRQTTFRSTAELSTAIADLEAEIALQSPSTARPPFTLATHRRD